MDLRRWAAGPLAILALSCVAPAIADPPVVTTDELAHEISLRMERVPEFAEIRRIADGLGVKAYLFGGTAAAYAHYVKQDLLRERGDPGFVAAKFDYDYTNIFRSQQDLDIVVDGPPEAARRLEKALNAKFPHFQGEKSAWEVRLLRERVGAKEALLDNPDFSNQHTDSHSTGLIEVSRPGKEFPVLDLRDWEHPRANQFLRDVLDGGIRYYFSALHATTARFRAGLNPPIFSAVRVLTKAVQYDLKIRDDDLERLRAIIDAFDPEVDLRQPYARTWMENNGRKLVLNAVNMEHAFDLLDSLGLRRKLLRDVERVGSLGWWMNREPLRTAPLGSSGKRASELAAELGLREIVVAHETNSHAAWESITKSRKGEANVLISRAGRAGETAASGDGFYTRLGRAGARGTGITIRFRLHPDAREGQDFLRVKDYIVVKNKAALTIIHDDYALGFSQYVDLVVSGKSVDSNDRAQFDKLRRRLWNTRSLVPQDEIDRSLAILRAALAGRPRTDPEALRFLFGAESDLAWYAIERASPGELREFLLAYSFPTLWDLQHSPAAKKSGTGFFGGSGFFRSSGFFNNGKAAPDAAEKSARALLDPVVIQKGLVRQALATIPSPPDRAAIDFLRAMLLREEAGSPAYRMIEEFTRERFTGADGQAFVEALRSATGRRAFAGLYSIYGPLRSTSPYRTVADVVAELTREPPGEAFRLRSGSTRLDPFLISFLMDDDQWDAGAVSALRAAMPEFHIARWAGEPILEPRILGLLSFLPERVREAIPELANGHALTFARTRRWSDRMEYFDAYYRHANPLAGHGADAFGRIFSESGDGVRLLWDLPASEPRTECFESTFRWRSAAFRETVFGAAGRSGDPERLKAWLARGYADRLDAAAWAEGVLDHFAGSPVSRAYPEIARDAVARLAVSDFSRSGNFKAFQEGFRIKIRRWSALPEFRADPSALLNYLDRCAAATDHAAFRAEVDSFKRALQEVHPLPFCPGLLAPAHP